MRTCLSLVLSVLIFSNAAWAAPPETVTVTIAERSGVSRDNEVVVFGLPIPREWNVTSVDALLVNHVNAAHLEPLARWGAPLSDTRAPLKWVRVAMPIWIKAGATAKLTFDHTGPAAGKPDTVTIDHRTPGKLIVNTQDAVFEINTGDDFNLINQVSITGKKLLTPLPPAKAIAYKPVGDQSVVDVANVTLRKTRVTVERQGRTATVKAVGSILDGHQRPVLDFTARMHFTAVSPDVRIDFTVENNHPIIPDETGQPTNVHNQGAVGSVYVGSLKLAVKLAGNTPATVLTEQGIQRTQQAPSIRLYQDAAGNQHWNAYVGKVGWPEHQASCQPRLQSFCTQKGFTIYEGVARLVSGDAAQGWLAVGRGNDGPYVLAAMRDFAANFPKALEGSPDGTISVDLFPRGNQFRHNLRVGEQKTHTLLMSFGHDPLTAATAERKARALNAPLVAVVPPQWYATCNVLPELPPADLDRWPLYERYVRTAFEPNPDFDPTKDDPNHGNTTLLNRIQKFNFYGWQDYGDLPLDYEAFGDNQAGQMNLKYWFLQAMLQQFCRSGDTRWMALAAPAARHLSDIDFLHIPDSGAKHWAHGAYFGHSQHDEPGNLNPNRNSNSPSVDLFYGVSDLLLAYHLTGEKRFAEVAMEGVVSMKAMSEFVDFHAPLFERERANMILAYIAAYRHSGDKLWLDELHKVVASITDLSNKPWVADPAAYGKKNPGVLTKTFMLSQNLWALGRYLDFCTEYGIKDPAAVTALAAYSDFILNHAMKEYAPGRAAMPYAFYFDGTTNDQTYLDINNWALVAADALAYAYKYTGKRTYLTAAARFYATGTIDPAWKDDPPVYIDSKGLANSCNWGMVYMNQAAQK